MNKLAKTGCFGSQNEENPQFFKTKVKEGKFRRNFLRVQFGKLEPNLHMQNRSLRWRRSHRKRGFARSSEFILSFFLSTKATLSVSEFLSLALFPPGSLLSKLETVFPHTNIATE